MIARLRRPRGATLLLALAACSPESGDTAALPTTSTTGGASTSEPTTTDGGGASTAPDPSTSSTGTTADPSTGVGGSSSTGGDPVAPQVLLPRASLQAAELAVLANDQDPQSMAVAAYYLEQRQIPQANLVVLSFPVGDALTAADFAGLKGQVDAAVGPDIEAFAVAWTKPYRVDCQSLVSALALGHDPGKYCSQPCSETAPTDYFDSNSLRPYTDHGLRPAMHLAGTSVDNVKAVIDRGVAADGTQPVGTGYFVRTTDPDRSVRFPYFMATVDQWNSPDLLKMEYRDLSAMPGADFLTGETDILFYFTGLASVPDIEKNTYLPGAVADHLTSYGGQICDSGQMSICRWLEAGATGSYGTAVEPCNYPAKFTDTAKFVAHYWRGETLLEAYWKSVHWPGEGVFIGEPLARPFAGATVEFDPGTLELTITTTQFAPGVTYSISTGPTDQGPWTEIGTFTPKTDARAAIKLQDATEPFYKIDVAV
jgi:uncharacterized protein (TIGR03790 family)